MAEISIDNIITVAVVGASRGLGMKNVNTVALFTTETPDTAFDLGYKSYKRASDIATDFGTDSDTYKMGVALFSQNPNVLSARGAFIVIPYINPAETYADAIIRSQSLIYSAGIMTNRELTDVEALAASDTVQTLDSILLLVADNVTALNAGGLLKQINLKGNFKTKGLLYTLAADKLKMMAAYAGGAFTTNFNGSNTTSTRNLKDLIGILPDDGITQTTYDLAATVGADIYVSIDGLPKLISNKNVVFFDSAYNRLWLKIALQIAGFNALAQTKTKIPQTEAGMNSLKNALRPILLQGVRNGFLAPGTWNSPDLFGVVEDLYRNVSEFGFYVYSQPITEQLQAEREQRIAPLIQMAVKEAGAIHGASIIVNIEE